MTKFVAGTFRGCFRAIPLIMLAASLSGAPVETAWKELMAEAGQAQDRGGFTAAEFAYRSAMRLAAQITDDPQYQGITAHNLAVLYQHHGDIALAEKYYLAAFSLFRRSSDRSRDKPSAANLASLYLETGQVSKAEGLLRPFLPDDTLPSGADADDAILLNNLASVRAQENRLADAERLFQAVIGFFQDRHDAVSEEARAIAMSNLAELFSFRGRVSEAAAYSRRAVSILENVPDRYAGNLIRGLVNLAVLTATSGASSEAEDLFRRAIATAEPALGPEHPLLGDVLVQYGTFLRRMKRNVEAHKVERRAKQIQTKWRQENHLGYTVEVSALAAKSNHQQR